MEKNFVSFENINYDELDKILLSLEFVRKNNRSKMDITPQLVAMGENI